MSESGLPLLSLVLVTLPIGAGLIWLAPSERLARWIALFAAGIDLALTLAMVSGFDRTSGSFQFVEQIAWIPTLNVNYLVGVDGTHTKWGVWSPQSLNHDPEWAPEKPLNSLEILSFLNFLRY